MRHLFVDLCQKISSNYLNSIFLMVSAALLLWIQLYFQKSVSNFTNQQKISGGFSLKESVVPGSTKKKVFSELMKDDRLKKINQLFRSEIDQAAVIRFLSFGFLPVFVDYLWTQFLIEEDLRLLLLSELDPFFRENYLYGSTGLAIIHHEPEKAERLLERGIDFIENKLPQLPQDFQQKFFPESWGIYLAYGYVEIFEMSKFSKGFESFKKGGAYEKAPFFMKLFREQLKGPLDFFDAALKGLATLKITHSKDPKAMEALGQKRKKVEFLRSLYLLNIEFKGFLQNFSHKKKKPHPGTQPELVQKAFGSFQSQLPSARKDPWGKSYFLKENQITSESASLDFLGFDPKSIVHELEF